MLEFRLHDLLAKPLPEFVDYLCELRDQLDSFDITITHHDVQKLSYARFVVHIHSPSFLVFLSVCSILCSLDFVKFFYFLSKGGVPVKTILAMVCCNLTASPLLKK
jgi:hypothetical protein